MDIEFDQAKEAINHRKHGVSLAVGALVLESRFHDVPDLRDYNGETRRIAYGTIAGRVFVCVYTMRGAVYRLISVRKANKREQRRWQP